MKISDRIKQIRENSKMTQQEFANKLEVQKALVAHWETNRNNPKLENLIRICELFNVTSDWILFGKNELAAKVEQPTMAIDSISLRKLLSDNQLMKLQLDDISEKLLVLNQLVSKNQAVSNASDKDKISDAVKDQSPKKIRKT